MKKPQSDTGRAYWTGKEFMSVGILFFCVVFQRFAYMDMDFLHSQFASIRPMTEIRLNFIQEVIGITRVDFSIICPLLLFVFFLINKWSWKSQRKSDESNNGNVNRNRVQIKMNFVLHLYVDEREREQINMKYDIDFFFLSKSDNFVRSTPETINWTKPHRF